MFQLNVGLTGTRYQSLTWSLDFVLNGVFRRIFLIKSYDVASECVTFFDCSVSDAIYKRKLKFLTKLRHSENTICKLFEKCIVEELDTVQRHFV